MRKQILAAAVWSALAATAWAGTLEGPDQKAVEGVISGQLNAFLADKPAEAYSYAAPVIQQMFGDPEQFIGMVKRGYMPVYRSKSFTFGESFTDQLGRPAQRVMLTAQDGKRYEAVYYMEKQPDGSWKIAGCTLLQIPGADV